MNRPRVTTESIRITPIPHWQSQSAVRRTESNGQSKGPENYFFQPLFLSSLAAFSREAFS
jgi:hypothetical protein